MLFLGYSIDSGYETPCEMSKRSIIRKIKGIDETTEEHTLIVDNMNLQEPLIIPEEEIIQNTSRAELLDYVDSVESSFNNWIVEIENEAKEIVSRSDDGDRDNLMFNLPFAVFFRKTCKLLLLWSAICCPIFGSPYETASSSNVESDFKNVKLSLDHVIPCRVDVFVQNHLEMLDGAVKIASKQYIETIGEGNSEPEDDLMESEGESGRITDSNEKADSNHEDECFLEDNQIGSNVCVACANGHSPGGAHTCDNCGKNVHILAGCSLSIGGEEGFGEKRICIGCSTKKTGTARKQSKKSVTIRTSRKSARLESTAQSKNTIRTSVMAGTKKPTKHQPTKSTFPANLSNKATRVQSIIHTELNHKEAWSKRRKTKRSVYIKPSPHWDLITNIDKRVKLGVLSNGNLSKTVHRINKKVVAVGNTCSFDSIAQVMLTIIFMNRNPLI